jgi:hypothetical protein
MYCIDKILTTSVELLHVTFTFFGAMISIWENCEDRWKSDEPI